MTTKPASDKLEVRTYEQGFSDSKQVALAIVENFIGQFPALAQPMLREHLLAPLESMQLKKKEQIQ